MARPTPAWRLRLRQLWPHAITALVAGFAGGAAATAAVHVPIGADSPPAALIQFDVIDGKGLAGVWTDGGAEAHLPLGVPASYTGVRAAVLSAHSAEPDGATCRITVDGVVVDEARGNRALCVWAP